MSSQNLYYLVKLIKYVVLAVLFALSMVLIYQYSRITELNYQKNKLQQEYNSNSTLISQYNEILDNFDDNEYYEDYIDNYARNELNMSKQDEIIIVVK